MTLVDQSRPLVHDQSTSLQFGREAAKVPQAYLGDDIGAEHGPGKQVRENDACAAARGYGTPVVDTSVEATGSADDPPA